VKNNQFTPYKMRKLLFVTTFTLNYLCPLIAQDTIDVADLTFKLAEQTDSTHEVKYPREESQTFEYAFAEGDQIVFNFEELTGRDIDRIEIKEYEASSKFYAIDTKGITNKIIKVPKTAVYSFNFFSSKAVVYFVEQIKSYTEKRLFKKTKIVEKVEKQYYYITQRLCRIKIQRIPSSKDLVHFNTSPRWKYLYDTAYCDKKDSIVVGYTSVNVQKFRKITLPTQTDFVILVDKFEKIKAIKGKEAEHTVSVNFRLPENEQRMSHIHKTQKTKVVSWAYSIAIGGESNWYKDAERKVDIFNLNTYHELIQQIKASNCKAVGYLAYQNDSTYTQDNSFANVPKVSYSLSTNNLNRVLYRDYVFVGTAKQRTDCLKTGYELSFKNMSISDVTIDVKVVAIVETTGFQEEPYMEVQQIPIKQERITQKPVIKTNKIPVFVD
jgi:hypothetical protein